MYGYVYLFQANFLLALHLFGCLYLLVIGQSFLRLCLPFPSKFLHIWKKNPKLAVLKKNHELIYDSGHKIMELPDFFSEVVAKYPY